MCADYSGEEKVIKEGEMEPNYHSKDLEKAQALWYLESVRVMKSCALA